MQRGGRVGGVERREHEVTGERGLHRDASGLDVSHLADEDHVGVLAQDGLQTAGERDVGLLVDLDLVDAGEDVLDRVFDGRDVALGIGDLVQRRVERGGLSAAGRAGQDHHAERRPDQPREVGLGLGREPEGSELEQGAAAVEQPQDDLLAPDRGHGRDPDVERSTVDGHLDLAVLRSPTLDDVHLGHDLDPAAQRLRDRCRELGRVVQRTVDPEADADLAVLRLDVDVGRALADRLRDDALHHLHDRRVVVDLVDALDVAEPKGRFLVELLSCTARGRGARCRRDR